MAKWGNNEFECSAVTSGVEIELTNHCGLKCRTCVREQADEFGFMSLADFKRAVDVIAQGSYGEIMVCGLGDGLLHPDLEAMLEYLHGRIPDIRLYFMTKGQALTAGRIAAIRKRMDAGMKVSLTFSVFSLDPKKYAFLTGGDDLRRFMASLLAAKKAGLDLSIELMVSPLTLGEIPKFKALAAKLGSDCGFSVVHNWGGRLDPKTHALLFDREKMAGHFARRAPGDVCEVMKNPFLHFGWKGEVFQCSLNELSRKGYLGRLDDADADLEFFLKKKAAVDYDAACSKCFCYSFKTF